MVFTFSLAQAVEIKWTNTFNDINKNKTVGSIQQYVGIKGIQTLGNIQSVKMH